MDNSIGKKVFNGTIIIVLVGILAKITSFIAEAILAAYLGTTYQSDAYYMVSSISLVLYPMMSVGIWKVFLPIYKEKITHGRLDEANALSNKVITVFTLASITAVCLLVLFAEPVVSLIAPGFKGETKVLCITLVRISAPMYLFIIASAIYASMLQCHERFFGSQIREVASHIPTILAAILLYRHFGIKVLAIALVFGGLLRLLVELPFVNWDYHFRPDFRFKTPEFSLIAARLPSALLSEGVIQLNGLVDKVMASKLPEGTISGLNYGHRLVHVFSGLLSSAVATALYPQMIELIAKNQREALSKLTVRIINIFCVMMVPITVACVLFRRELVSVVYQRGSFDEASTVLTSGVFAFYSLYLFFAASNTVIGNLFYGHGNTKTPLYFNITYLLTNVALNLVFIRFWGANGLALATSCSTIIAFMIRLIAARRYISIELRSSLLLWFRVLLAAGIACGVPRLLFTYLTVNRYQLLIGAAVIGVPLYFGLIKLLRISELDDLLSILLKRRKKRDIQ